MAKTKLEKIANLEDEIKKLKDEQKLLQQQHNEQERKLRTKRLCKRAGYLEKILPDTITLTDEQFDLFLDKTLLTDFTRKMLANIISGQIKPAEKSAETAQNGITDENGNGGNGTRQAG